MGGAVAGAIDNFIPLPIDGVGYFIGGKVMKNNLMQQIGGIQIGESLADMFLSGGGLSSLTGSTGIKFN